jgi:hypothetical protein
MIRTALAAAVSLAALAAPAFAQTPLSLTAPASGTLTDRSAKTPEGAPFDLYVLRAKPGDRVRIDLASEAFDTYLAAGADAGPTCGDACVTNDDGPNGTNSRVTVTVPASGVLQVRAGALGGDGRGAYTLAAAVVPPLAAPRALTVGQAASGALGPNSADLDGQRADLWVVRAAPGTQLVARLNTTAEGVDPLLKRGTFANGGFVEEEQDDDGGPGLNARIRFTMPASGQAVFAASALGSEAEGPYTLLVEPPLPKQPLRVATLTLGEAVNGVLDAKDIQDPETEAWSDYYKVSGRPGQRVRITVNATTPGMNPQLSWGVIEGETQEADYGGASNDDGTGGVINVTLDEDGAAVLRVTSIDMGTMRYTLSAVGLPRPAR